MSAWLLLQDDPELAAEQCIKWLEDHGAVVTLAAGMLLQLSSKPSIGIYSALLAWF